MENLMCTNRFFIKWIGFALLSICLWTYPVKGAQDTDSLTGNVDSLTENVDSITESVDSLTAQQTTLIDNEKQMVQQWQSIVGQWGRQLDSVKRKLSWERNTPDTLLIDSVLTFLKNTKSEITVLDQSIKEAKVKEGATADKLFVTDSANVVELALNDSTKLQFAGLKDTLQRIEGNIKRLLADIDYLESTTIQQREEAKAAESVAPKRAVAYRLAKTAQKNLVTDGVTHNYFSLPAWGSRFLLILCGVLYFYWLFRLGRKPGPDKQSLLLHKNEPVWIPLLKACVFFLVLLPFTSFTVPVLVLEVSYFLIFLLLYTLVYKELSPFKRKVQNIIFLYYLALLLVNLFLSEQWWSRAAAISTNLLAIGLVWSIGRKTDVDNPMGYMHRYARWALILGNIIAIVLNATGYLALSRMWSLVTGIGLLQAISLRAFRDMLLHDLENYYNKAEKESMIRRFNLTRLLHSFDRLIRFCNGVLIVLVVLNNLHLTREAANVWDKILSTPRQLGGVSFTYGNLLLAVAVIWVANWFQKNLNNLVNSPNARDVDRQKMALFPLFRLVIVVVGFLFGISILGLGMDKLTVILGALSVGVGLGLQNIINNFVSGIILVFEKPFKLGDYVEIGDKKGQIMQIGIRSSTLLNDQGARVIIPNGDLLSGRLVNWTFSDSDIRLNMQLTVDNTVDLPAWKEWLKQTIQNFEEVDTKVPLKIWTKDVTADAYQIAIQVGIRHMRLIEKFRSRFLEVIKKEMDEKQIKITSS